MVAGRRRALGFSTAAHLSTPVDEQSMYMRSIVMGPRADQERANCMLLVHPWHCGKITHFGCTKARRGREEKAMVRAQEGKPRCVLGCF